jgi:hypothetical protein
MTAIVWGAPVGTARRRARVVVGAHLHLHVVHLIVGDRENHFCSKRRRHLRGQKGRGDANRNQ